MDICLLRSPHWVGFGGSAGVAETWWLTCMPTARIVISLQIYGDGLQYFYNTSGYEWLNYNKSKGHFEIFWAWVCSRPWIEISLKYGSPIVTIVTAMSDIRIEFQRCAIPWELFVFWRKNKKNPEPTKYLNILKLSPSEDRNSRLFQGTSFWSHHNRYPSVGMARYSTRNTMKLPQQILFLTMDGLYECLYHQ